jgi:carboxypeptidase Taq
MESEFMAYSDRMNALVKAVTLFQWDMSTGAPKGGSISRSKQIGILAGEQFAMAVSEDMKRFLEADSDGADDVEKAALRISRKFYNSWKSIPQEEIADYSAVLAQTQDVWEKAKAESDYGIFAPSLEKIIECNRRFAVLRGSAGNPYDTLLDDYEEGMTTVVLDAFFEKLKKTIVPLVKEIGEKGRKIDAGFLKRPVPIDAQKKISKLLMERLGFDFNRGMLKESVHPFTLELGKNDVRITTNYHEDDFLSSFYSVLHETGHALYEQNIDDSMADTIVDKGASMGIHESQSRFYENMVGRSLEFWESIHGSLISLLGAEFSSVTAEDFYYASNRVKPSLIRIESDELTYSLHIMVRYEMEKEIILSGCPIEKLPSLWSDKMSKYLGVIPPNDAQGILQDVHWSQGSFGYFPSYALGNAYAAQFLHFMKKSIPVDGLIRSGDLSPITGWLKDKIHRHGSVLTPAEIVESATGEALDTSYFTDYLEKKFSGIYF